MGWQGWCSGNFTWTRSKRVVSFLRQKGRRQDRIKGPYWEGDGFLLVYKRLENGSFQWSRNGNETKEITVQQYRWLMEGLSVELPKAHRPVEGLKLA